VQIFDNPWVLCSVTVLMGSVLLVLGVKSQKASRAVFYVLVLMVLFLMLAGAWHMSSEPNTGNGAFLFAGLTTVNLLQVLEHLTRRQQRSA
jgi:uncharacterized membrane protein